MIWIVPAIVLVVPLVGLYFLLIRSMDRYHPAPWWVLALCLVWGAVGAIGLSVVGDLLGQGAISFAMDLDFDDEQVFNASATFVAPLVEEPAKAFGLLFIYFFSRKRGHESLGPLRGAVFGGIIGLGFTLTEDILYIIQGANKSGGAGFVQMFFLRTVMLGLGHATFTAMTGLGFGLFATMKSRWRWAMPLAGLGLGMLLHFGRNLFGSYLLMEGLGVFLVVLLNAVVVLALFGLLVWLGWRDRQRIIEGLQGVTGVLITSAEYAAVTNGWMLLPGWNLFNLIGLPGGFRAARRKQTHLFQLAFHRQRARHAPPTDPTLPPTLDSEEDRLIAEIHTANQQGIHLALEAITLPPVLRG
jgi:RsiW-degrading membrane proteinase PrsW (M82 family)